MESLSIPGLSENLRFDPEEGQIYDEYEFKVATSVPKRIVNGALRKYTLVANL